MSENNMSDLFGSPRSFIRPLAEGQYHVILTPEEYADPEIRKAFGMNDE